MSPPPAEQFAARIFIGPVLRAQPDRRLVDLVRDGYDGAFEEIVRRYRRQLDRFAAAIVGGRSEDVTQDAFSKALLALRGSETEIELRPWLYRIVRNTALNDLRDRAPAAEELSEALPGGRSAAAEAEGREELRDLMGRLQALPEPQRAALVMRELEGLSHEEIAAALGVSGGAARQAIFRARATLREGLGLLLPLPALRIFAQHGSEVVKAGAATVLIAGSVGAGVAIEHHGRGGRDDGVAEAAPLAVPKAGHTRAGTASGFRPTTGSGASGHKRADEDHGSGGGESRGSDFDGSLSMGESSGPSASVPSRSPNSGHSTEETSVSGSGGPGPNSGSGSGDRHGGSGSDDSVDDHSGLDDGGSISSGESGGSDDGATSGESQDNSGPGGGESVSEPIADPEPDPVVVEEPQSDDSSSGETELSSGGTSGSDQLP
ncbi:MAG TPA: RNA polymerase sigma factor [Solirubrobacterales bacterium]|nr:RNA polymerase sigma factor [Solirubrobacterales bacterium]